MLQGAQQRRMHDMVSLVSEGPVLQPEAVMKMLASEVSCPQVFNHLQGLVKSIMKHPA